MGGKGPDPALGNVRELIKIMILSKFEEVDWDRPLFSRVGSGFVFPSQRSCVLVIAKDLTFVSDRESSCTVVSCRLDSCNLIRIYSTEMLGACE